MEHIAATATTAIPAAAEHARLRGIRQLSGVSLHSFGSIGLGELGAAALMRREDTKYLFGVSQLTDVLTGLEEHYDLLEVNGLRVHDYLTLYFDNSRLALFQAHHRGLGNRVKVRERRYLTTGRLFRELKHRSNKGVTTKVRTEAAGWSDVIYPWSWEASEELAADPHELLRAPLTPVLWNAYKRLTLVRRGHPERVTLDTNLSFSVPSVSYGSGDFVVAEVKQARVDRSSPFMQRLRLLSVRPGGFSKYCIGVSLISRQVSHNRFKPTLRRLNAFSEVTPHAA